METRFIKYLNDTLIKFEQAKGNTEFTDEQTKVVDSLSFAYIKALNLIKEYDERTQRTLSDHRGYQGSVALNQETKEYYGRLLGLSDVVRYDNANNLPELTRAFHHAIDVYLASCKEAGIEPEK